MTFSKKPLFMVELKQKKCSRTFGVAPCNATGTPCYNTDFTCKFRDALDLTETIDLQFVHNDAYEWIDDPLAFQPSLAIPLLESVSTAPTVLNVASGSKNKSPLGYRAVFEARFKDAPSNDFEVDPYVATRGYDPTNRGSFWSKWLARNPFHLGFQINSYEGFIGDALGDMIKRRYEVEKFDHDRNGVSMTAKDPLRRITDTDVTYPATSPGELTADITIGQASFQVAGASLTDYDAANGRIRIDDEIIFYANTSTVGVNVQFNGCVRGDLGTNAATHSALKRVQKVVRWQDVRYDDILYELIVTGGKLDPALINFTDWSLEVTRFRPAFLFSAVLSQPVKILELIGEICLQSLSNLWWDERIEQIILKAVRPDEIVPTITESDIVDKSFSYIERPEERISRVDVYYSLRSAISDVNSKENYSQVASYTDVTRTIQYGGEISVKELLCRFIQSSPVAQNLAVNYLDRFKDVRLEATFKLPYEIAKLYWTGQTVPIEHFLKVDIHGNVQRNNWLIIEAEASVPGGEYTFVVEDANVAGVLWFWADDTVSSATWALATPEEREVIPYWLNDDGTDVGGTPRPWRWL